MSNKPDLATRLHVVLFSLPEALSGTLHSTLDALRTVALFMSLQHPKQPYLFSWEIRSPTGARMRWPGITSDKVCPQRRSNIAADRTLFVIPAFHVPNSPRIGEIVETHAVLLDLLEKHAAAGGWIAASYTGIAFPARLGLLDGARISAPWTHEAWFSRIFTNCAFSGSGPISRHGRVFTSITPGLQTEFALAVIGALGYHDLANAAGQVLLYQERRQELIHDLIEKKWTAKTSDSPVRRAIAWLNSHIDQPYSLAALAAAATTSERTLLRHFQQVTGMTPLDYLHDLRVERAKMLLEVTLQTVHTIAQACGYSDVSSFRRIFRSVTGTSPTEYRTRFTLRARRRHWRVESFA